MEVLAETLQDFIPDDATCISVKVNIPDYDPSDNNVIMLGFGSSIRYLKDSGVEILAMTGGLHLNGRNKVPHFHYHIIANHYNPKPNQSEYRKRWLAKKGNETENFDGATFKFESLETGKPKYQFLSYPMKEGYLLQSKCYQYDGAPMTKDMKDFLYQVGTTIYQTQCALRLRQEKCQERKQLAFNELCALVGDRNFSSFRELCMWFDENYLYKLEYEDIPDPKNYKSNIRKIGIKKRLLTTFDL